jgi:hypothetical protein
MDGEGRMAREGWKGKDGKGRMARGLLLRLIAGNLDPQHEVGRVARC